MASGSYQNSEGLAYDVFLSFRGEDVRKSFIDHLRASLKREGIAAIFYDDTGLERGDEIQSKLYEAIDRSKVAIVTFSPRYAESRWCLDELVRIMEHSKSHGLMVVLPVFYYVEPTDVRHQTGPYQEAFRKHMAAKIDRVSKWRQVLASAADLAGFGLQNQANGYEAKLIEHIVNDVVMKLDPRQLDIPKYMVEGESSSIHNINRWLQNGSSKVEVGIIYGPGGVGKTTVAKVVYNANYRIFKFRSFLANVRTASQKDSDFIRLQTQLICNITRNEDIKIDTISQGREKIKNVIGTQKVLVVLDDVEDVAQFHKIFDYPNWFFSGSKILITTRDGHLLINETSIVRFATCFLDQRKSTELFSYHAFGQTYPPKENIKISMLFIDYCGGLPLALKVLASSLRSIHFEMWKSQYERLQDYLDEKVFNVLSWSFDSLHDTVKDIFLHIAFYMIGRNKKYALKILDGCGLHGGIGLEDLIGKCLVSVDKYHGTLSMHHLIQQMGYEVVRQKPPIELGRRSRILGQKDAYKVLLNIKKKSAVKGLHLDNPDPHDDDTSLNEMYVANTLERMSTTHIYRTNSSRQDLQRSKPIKTSAFTNMENLDLLLLENVELYGSFDDFPKGIKWLLWKGCPLKEIPLDYELDELVVLDMQNSCLVQLWNGLKHMSALKILNLSHSHQLVNIPDLSNAFMLEWIWCEDCINLIDIHESIGKLENLTQLNVKGCVNLVTLPQSIRNLKKRFSLKFDGCRNLKNLPINIGSVLRLDGCPGLVMGGSYEGSSTAIYPSSCSKSALFRFNIFLPALEILSLVRCGISRDDVMEMLSFAPMLWWVNLSSNPIPVMGNMGSSTCPKLYKLELNDCSNLQYVSNILKVCKLWVEDCESLKGITYHREMNVVKEKQRRDLIQGNGCLKIVEKKHVVPGDVVIERTSEMSEDRATYLGFPKLIASDYAGTSCCFCGRGVYQAGTYCVWIPGYRYSMLAEWFPTKSVAGPYCFKKRYRVPYFHPIERRIRALNVGCLGTDGSTRDFEIKNISRMWRWCYKMPRKLFVTKPVVDAKCIWLIHWCVTEHRQIIPGDLLKIEIDNYKCVGVKLIYEDGEEGQLEEEVEEEMEEFPSDDEENDGSATDDDVAVWYNHTFRSPDLSFYESPNAPTNWRLYDIKAVGGRDAVIEWTNRMTEDRSAYLGFPYSTFFGDASMSRKSYERGVFQAGTYCVCIHRDCYEMVEEWFAAKLGTGPHCFIKRYKVPSFHPKERPIRGLIVGCLGIGLCELVIMNISRMWKWAYSLTRPYHGLWLTHWCVAEHRQIAPGDVLRIFIDEYERVGVRVIYEDGEGAELEVDVDEEDNDDDSDADASATDDVAVWYNRTFRSTDLYSFESGYFAAPEYWRWYKITLFEVEYGIEDIAVFERTSEMNEDLARYLGFPVLSALGPGSHEWEVYQAGTYCVCISDDNLSKLAEWFPATKLGTGPYCFSKRYRVPCLHLKERRIRALNVGFLGTDKSRMLVVENITRKWTWHYCLLRQMVKNNSVWLTHWCVMKHRHVTHGDLLRIEIGNCECVGVKLIYEDGEEAELEEEEKIIELDSQNGGQEDNDNSADIAVWYDQNFRSTDLSLYESPNSHTQWSQYTEYEISYPFRSCRCTR